VNLPPMIDDLGEPLPFALGDEQEERPRVLVVDDDERNLLAIENVLEDVGEVVIARSGEEALRHLLKGEFAVNRQLKRDDHGLGAGDYVVLAATDNGCGISPDHLEQVLEPFFTTKEVGKGTGLGLSMVYGFAQQSGGAFRLASELGKGTTAEIWLPRAAASQAPAAVEVEVEVEVEQGLADIAPLDILLVDDHADVRRTTAAMLEELGHRIIEAQSGHDALALLDVADRPCDLIVTDYAMPRLSGTDLIREARARRAGLPALIITGYADADAIGERPADVAILAKPFTLESLSRAVASAACACKSRAMRAAAG